MGEIALDEILKYLWIARKNIKDETKQNITKKDENTPNT